MYMLVTFVFLMDQYSGTKVPLRIYGSEDANPDEYPYVVRLEIEHTDIFKNKTVRIEHDHLCTASALSPTWSVTAAHCFSCLGAYIAESPFTTSKLVIRYGSAHESPWKNYSLSDVVATFGHPLYTFANHENDYNGMHMNDIGLLETKPVILRIYMKVSAVDYTTMYGHEAVFAGFGVTSKKTPSGNLLFGNTLELRKPLQVINVLILKCSRDERMIPAICLGNKCGVTRIVCGGDSGGPLIHPSGIAGVLSLGESSGFCLDAAPKTRTEFAGIIVPISPYLEWIRGYVKS